MEANKTAMQKDLDLAVALLSRMMPALLSGSSFEDAGRAVLKRDQELMKVATSDSDKGALIRSHLADRVYVAIKAKVFAERQAQIAKESAIKDFLTSARADLAKAGAI